MLELTKVVLVALGDHFAIDFVDCSINLLEIVTVGDDLVPSDDVLSSISSKLNSLPSGGTGRSKSLPEREKLPRRRSLRHHSYSPCR